MKKSFFLLSILAAISVVAAEAPAAQAAFGTGDKVAVPDNFAFDASSSQTVLSGEKFHFQVPNWNRFKILKLVVFLVAK